LGADAAGPKTPKQTPMILKTGAGPVGQKESTERINRFEVARTSLLHPTEEMSKMKSTWTIDRTRQKSDGNDSQGGRGTSLQ
jgi:hypothetical protein